MLAESRIGVKNADLLPLTVITCQNPTDRIRVDWIRLAAFDQGPQSRGWP